MEERGGYGQFCPVSMASEILCSRWTTLVLRELLAAARGSMTCGAACRRCRRRCSRNV